MRVSVHIDKVKIGDVIHTALDSNDNLLRENYVVRTEDDIQQLKNLGVRKATVDRHPTRKTGPAEIPEPPDPEELDDILEPKEPFDQSHLLYQHTVTKVEEIFVGIQEEQPVEPDELKPFVNRLLDFSLQFPVEFGVITQIEQYDTNTFNHCLNMAILALFYGEYRQYDPEQTRELAMAALLHDLGKLAVPADILDKGGELTNREFSRMKMHARLGHRLLKEYDVGEAILRPALEHHERPDGSGYPRGKSDLHPNSYVISVFDVYEALTSQRTYSEPVPPYEAYIRLREEFNQFEETESIVYDLVRCLSFYPVGSFVRLSNDDLAIVFQNRGKAPLRPIVCVIRNDSETWCDPPYLVDLKQIETKTLLKGTSVYNHEISIDDPLTPKEIDQFDIQRIKEALNRIETPSPE